MNSPDKNVTGCDCIRMVNRLLREHNTELETVTIFNPKGSIEERLCVPTKRLDTKKRKGPMRVFVTFCPMCGKKIPKSDAVREVT